MYRRVPRPRHILAVLFGALLAAGCGGPTSPSTLGPILVCPIPLTVVSVDGNAATVVYDLPQVVAGEPPLRTTCTPTSGSIFSLGGTTVSCSTTDAAARTAACTFTVTVVAPPRLSATMFMAFGNSITEGKTATGFTPNNYPQYLRGLLRTRYTAQSISVVNNGLGGEQTPEGSDRLKVQLDAVRPEVLLLEEGVNDILGGDPTKIAQVIDGLRDMVQKAKARGVRVFLATLTPARAVGTPFPRGKDALPLIPETNARIRLLAQSEGVTLVDLYNGFGGSPDPYIDTDGLHPTEAGYQKIAEIFFNAIKEKLELPQGTASFGIVRYMPSGAFPIEAFR